MAKTILLMGTLDTKGDQIEYLARLIKKKGHKTIIMDVGVLGQAPFEPDISKDQVARKAGVTVEDVIALGHESTAMGKMTEGAYKILEALNKKESVDGVLAFGGSMGTALALDVMATLPIPMPKVVLSTISYSPAINPDLLSNNLIMLSWVGGLWGINELSKAILDQAAGVVIGAAEAFERKGPAKKKTIGITSIGQSAARYLYHLRPALQNRDYEVSVFHATGMNTRLFEKAIKDGSLDFVLDLYAGQEIINEVCGSLFGPGSHRLEAAAEKGIPQIVSPGQVEHCFWSAHKPIPKKYSKRRVFQHNSILWVVYTEIEEKIKTARLMAKKLNGSKGPTAVIMPLKFPYGVIKMGVEDPEGNEAFREELKKNLKPPVKYLEVDISTDDDQFSDHILSLMDEMMPS